VQVQCTTMLLVHNHCEFADRQVIWLQETPDTVLEGQTLHMPVVSLSAYDKLMDMSKPGDWLVLMGIFHSTPICVKL
jgi:DNA replication licensing factor MCM4